MRESSRGRGSRSKAFQEQLFSKKPNRALRTIEEQLFFSRKLSRYGRAALALWGKKPGQYMAGKLKCSKRYADQIIRGDRKVSAKAAALLLNDII